MPANRIIPGVEDHYWGILSAFTKSMRVSNPTDSLYYLFLLRHTKTGVPSHVQMRTMSSGGEDGFAVRVMAHQLEWQHAQKNEKTLKGAELERMIELSVYSIAAQHSAYNSGEMGLGWNWTDGWQEAWVNRSRRHELGECDEQTLRKFLWALPADPLDREGYLEVLRWWRMLQNYGRAWESVHRIASEWAAHRGEQLGDKTLARFAKAYRPMCRWLSQEHGGMAENWFRRLVYFAARGTKGVRGTYPTADDPGFVEARITAMRLFQRRAAKGIVKIPCYAYDGKHCRADKGVRDARFCGHAEGNVNLYAMAERDGFIDVHAQGVTIKVEEKWLDQPYLTFKVEFPVPVTA